MNGLLASSRARNRAIVESSHNGILMLLPGGELERSNPAAREMLRLPEGPEARATRPLLEFVAPRSRPEVEAELARAGGGAGAEPPAQRRGGVPHGMPGGPRRQAGGAVAVRPPPRPDRVEAAHRRAAARAEAGVGGPPACRDRPATRPGSFARPSVSAMLADYRRAVGAVGSTSRPSGRSRPRPWRATSPASRSRCPGPSPPR